MKGYSRRRLQPQGDRKRHGGLAALPAGILVSVGILLLSAAAVASTERFPTPAEIDRIKSNLMPLDFTADRTYSQQLEALFRCYQLDSGKVPHRFGTFDSGTYRLAAHVYLPTAARGSVFVLHGLFDHAGLMQRLIHRCIDEGFAVAVFDLPGHGLSSGDPGAIADFSDYIRIFDDFVRICRPHLPQPYHLVGHSMGASIAIEAVLNQRSQMPAFERVVLAAPLVHHRFHRLARMQLFLIKPFVDDLPRRHHKNSSDPAFLRWSRHDPLQGRRISVLWLEALYAWNDRLSGYARRGKTVMVIQGTKDGVVHWRHNIAVLQQKFAAVRVVRIEGGRHQLFNESSSILAAVLEAVSSYLKEPAAAGKS